MGVYFMVNCCIHEDIYKGQIDKKKYRIWTVMGRESTLSYWYVVMSDETYEKEYNHENVDLESVDDKITDQAIENGWKNKDSRENSLLSLFFKLLLLTEMINYGII